MTIGTRGKDGHLIVEGADGVTRAELPALLMSWNITRKAALDALANRAEKGPVIIAPYLPASTRAAIRERDGSFVDAAGNALINDEAAGLFISADGAQRDPWAGPGRPRASLRGEPAARVVRALIDFNPTEWRVTELLAACGASTGAGYRVLDHLENEALIERPARGIVRVRSWPGLLRAWSADHGFATSGAVSGWLDPRGATNVLVTLSNDTRRRYAVTGSFAADQWAPYAPSRLAQIYVEDAVGAASAWGLRPATDGANVLLCETSSDIPYTRTISDERGAAIVAPSQAAVDLLTSPGRGPAEGEELIRWMEANEDAWRRRNP